MPGKSYDAVYEIAEDQLGYVTAAEAAAHGIRRDTLVHMAERGTLARVSQGVYRLVAFPVAPAAQYMEAVAGSLKEWHLRFAQNTREAAAKPSSPAHVAVRVFCANLMSSVWDARGRDQNPEGCDGAEEQSHAAAADHAEQRGPDQLAVLGRGERPPRNAAQDRPDQHVADHRHQCAPQPHSHVRAMRQVGPQLVDAFA